MDTRFTDALEQTNRSQQEAIEGRKNKVLLVEDSRAVNQLLVCFISAISGVDVESTDSLKGAAQLIANDPEQFFCAILDLDLPDAPDGEVVPLVQRAGIPVIVLSGNFDNATREAMLKLRVVDYVLKRNPAEVEYVAYLVERIFENQLVKVLVVDDSVAYRSYLVELLRRYQYQTLEAMDGERALRVLDEHPDIRLIITDFNMPKMDGRELIERIRRTKRREEIAIIGLSDQTKRDTPAMLLKCGANDFLLKRFEVEEFYCRVTQNTSMIGYVQQIREAATRDFLTRSYNRRHFFELAAPMYKKAKCGDIKLAAAIIDADHFKKINDSFGHSAGDEALKTMANTLVGTVRSSDIVARYGGEEFVCLTIVRNQTEAEILYERVRANLASAELYEKGERIRITASIGVATDLCGSLPDMLNRADQAVYKAKELGRNRVFISTGSGG